ncbi:MAG TPA: YceI family protein [Thiobacillaceae bacterium]|nr:YceI family protein [Thiobacillaceae bacterium]
MTVASLLAALVLVSAAHAGSYILDPIHTAPRFEIRHLALFTVSGRFSQSQGRITLDRDKGLDSVDATIQVNSLNTGSAMRDEDLLGPLFFDVARFPTMSFQSRRVTYLNKETAMVEGSFTLHGVTRPLSLHVTHIHCSPSSLNGKQVCDFDSWAVIKRSDFGIKAYIPLIADKVKLRISGEAIEDEDAP